jgi:hypothetical protein
MGSVTSTASKDREYSVEEAPTYGDLWRLQGRMGSVTSTASKDREYSVEEAPTYGDLWRLQGRLQ